MSLSTPDGQPPVSASAPGGPAASWRTPALWRFFLWFASVLVWPLCRLRVSGSVPAALRDGPLVLAVNHVSPIDPLVMMAACRRAGIEPRFMATGGVFRAPVLGWVMRRSGHIRVDRRSANVADALPVAAAALKANSTVLVYPEGRIGLDPWMWPERGKTGTARLAALSGAPVVPVAQWGTHRVMPYSAPKGALRALVSALVRRPVVLVRFGEPVDLSGLSGSSGAQAMRATGLIIEGIDRTLLPLRSGELETPRHIDRTRPADLTRARSRPGRPVPAPVPAAAAGAAGARFEAPAPDSTAPGSAAPGSAGSPDASG